MKKIFQATQCLSREEIEHYSKGELSDDLRFKIEHHLIDCPLCSEAIEGLIGLDEEGEEVLDDLYKAIDSRASQDKLPAPKRIIPWNSIAAAILVLFTVGAAYLYFQNNQSSENYFAYFKEKENLLATRSIEMTDLPNELKEGIVLFNNNNFQGSLSFFEDYLTANPESTLATYYAGKSALNIGAKEKALNLLSTVRMNDDKLYEEATWVLSGVYLERGELENAKRLLRDLMKIESGFYSESAEELLNLLE